ncbi:hypothetical protein [Vasconcelosia minhoensis]|uniref:hypothetical protein n=1 Tax=Vasconcelosia minhoensis TaxID=3366354 RepID=UPI002AD4A3AF|nr:hypothetical protein [Romeria gracilis]
MLDPAIAGHHFWPESYNWSVVQALISRSDRRLADLLELTRRYGSGIICKVHCRRRRC